jgi:cytoskeleton protein RodZ
LPHGDDWKKERLSELGSRVRARREELGLSIAQVSGKTRIRSKYLIAVEEGDDSISAGRTYFRAFLKTYASFLGLDGSALSAEYQDIIAEAEALQARKTREIRSKPQDERRLQPEPVIKTAPTTETSPSPAAESSTPPYAPTPGTYSAPRPHAARPRRRVPGERRRKTSGVWVLLLLLTVAATAYYLATARPASIFGPRAAVDPTGGEPVTDPVTDPLEEPDPPEPGNETPPEPSAPTVTRDDPNREKTVWSIDRTPLELTLKMRENSDSYCWVSVYTDGKHSFERTLTPGEVVSITAASEISIRAGKPWEMDITLNGQDLGPGGEFGPVKDLAFRSTVTAE